MSLFLTKILKREPFTQQVMGVEIKFKFDDEFCRQINALGRFISNTDTVVLQPSLSDMLLIDTAIHEVIEVVDFRLDMKMNHDHINNIAFGLSTVLAGQE